MTEYNTIRRVTVYSGVGMEETLITAFTQLGAGGYTIMECRGKGSHGLIEDPLHASSHIRIELLVQPEVGDKIMEYLHTPQFAQRAVSACLETVQVHVSKTY